MPVYINVKSFLLSAPRSPSWIMTKSSLGAMTMDDRTTTFGRKRGCTVTRCGAFGLALAFLGGVLVTGLLVYHFAPCVVGGMADRRYNGAGGPQSSDGVEISSFRSSRSFVSDSAKKKLDVRLPKSVVPHSYELKLIPFIWERNFTFNGEVSVDASCSVSLFLQGLRECCEGAAGKGKMKNKKQAVKFKQTN